MRRPRLQTDVDAERRARLIFVNRVREYMRDHAELNTLIEGEENSDRLIEIATETVLEDFSATPPIIGQFGVRNFPDYSLLQEGVVAHLMMSAAILFTRNDLDFAAGSMQVSMRHPQTYLQLAQMHRQGYEMKKRSTKVALNMDQAARSVQHINSEFARAHGSGHIPGH
jgi:hypothetical protein